MGDLDDPLITEDERAVRRAALVEALKTLPPDMESAWVRAMLIAVPIRRALTLWRERELTFPSRVRRMNPDEIDMASGAWAIMLQRAKEEAVRALTERLKAALPQTRESEA